MNQQVHLVVYTDPEDGSVEVDVYRNYNDAVDRFNESLEAAKNAGCNIEKHLDDTDWSFPYYKTESGYEVEVRTEDLK